MTDIDLELLTNARYMSLMSSPASPQAKALVEDVITTITNIEKRKKARRAKDLSTFKNGVGLILGDLLTAALSKEPRLSYHAMSPAAFTGGPIGFKTFNHIMNAMIEAGLIEEAVGRNFKDFVFNEGAKQTYRPGLATRWWPTEALLCRASEAGLTEETINKDFIHQLPKKVIEVRGKSKNIRGNKIRGPRLKTNHNEISKQMEGDLLELNSFLASFELDGAIFSGFRRIFCNGDVEGFNFQWGGRLYGVGDHNYQSLKSEERRKIKVNGDNLVEIDINASYLTILYGLYGFPLPAREDIYKIDGLPREIVKAWITATLGHSGFHSKWPKEASKELRNAGIVRPKKMTMTSLQPLILDYFPVLTDWNNCNYRWPELMYIESEIVIGTMLELMRSYSIPCYSVHDSIIVRKKDQITATEVLKNQFLDKVNIEPRLKIK